MVSPARGRRTEAGPETRGTAREGRASRPSPRTASTARPCFSPRALEALRGRAAEAGRRVRAGEIAADAAARELRELGRELRDARPTMAVVGNRVARLLHETRGATPAELPASRERAADAALARARGADRAAASAAARLVAGRAVLTLSRSGTVLAALRTAAPPPRRVWVAESAPEREGIGVAEELAGSGLSVTLLADAAVAGLLLSAASGTAAGGRDAPAGEPPSAAAPACGEDRRRAQGEGGRTRAAAVDDCPDVVLLGADAVLS